MTEHVKARRPYRSSMRAQRALKNREAILRAARRRFLTDGYPRTSVASIAAEAGVSEDLVYLLFTNKRGLLVEVLNFSVTGEVDSPVVLEQQGPLAVRDETDQRRQVAMFAHDIAHRVDRARSIDDVMRSAAMVDEAVAAKYESLQASRLENITQFVRWVAARGPLRGGVDVQEAAATAWALTGTDMHRMLVDGLGWDIDAYADWLQRTLQAALLPGPDAGSASD
jgi:AcrR family transcriptional regulator